MKLITRYYRFLRKTRKSRRNPPYPAEEAFRQGVGTITKLLGEVSKVSYSLPEGVQEAIVLVFHDYRGHIRTDAFLALFLEIAKAKCDIFSCDFPGHGMSVRRSQDLGWIDSVDHVLAVARAMVYRIIRSKSRGCLPIIIVGVSLGALVALRLLETQPFLAKRVRGVVCIATPLQVLQIANKWVRIFRPGLEFLDIFLRRFEWWNHMAIDAPFFTKAGRSHKKRLALLKDPLAYHGPLKFAVGKPIFYASEDTRREISFLTTPACFIHGIDDGTCPFSVIEHAYHKVSSKHKKLVVVEGDHYLLETLEEEMGEEEKEKRRKAKEVSIKGTVDWIGYCLKLPK